ncbi:hypothetical protein [Acinetobacter haemolyticus]|uniref:hypothetical protein n=1 Tax=Acinetobacter haemolyticus TaxID=29430 RepID=UPI0024DEC1FC|nr:hypothetical protein [Acinetobacter haemolyticus]
MTNENIDISNELALISELEDFLFLQIQTSFKSTFRNLYSIWNAKSKEELKQEIYQLHDEGVFKETEEQIQVNLNQNSENEYSFAKKPLHPRPPQHYDEVITQLREFHKLVENKQYQMAKKKQREVIFTYANHYDCSILASVPENLRENMQQMQARNVRTYRYDIPYPNICYDYISELLASSIEENCENLDTLYDFLDYGVICISKTDTLSHRIQTAIKEQINYYEDRKAYLEKEHNEQKTHKDAPLKKLLRKKTKRMPPIYLDFENESFCFNRPTSDHFTMKSFMKKNFTKTYDAQIGVCMNSIDYFRKELKKIENNGMSSKNSECITHINSRKWLEEYPELRKKLEEKFIN